MKNGGPPKKRFDEIFSKGKVRSSRLVRIIALPGNGSIGVATAKAIGCHAERNHVKRRCRAALRELDLGPLAKLDFVIVAKLAVKKAPYHLLVKDLNDGVNGVREEWESELALPLSGATRE